MSFRATADAANLERQHAKRVADKTFISMRVDQSLSALPKTAAEGTYRFTVANGDTIARCSVMKAYVAAYVAPIDAKDAKLKYTTGSRMFTCTVGWVR